MSIRITLIISLIFLANCTVPGQSYYNYPIPSYNTYYPPTYQNFRYAPSPPMQNRYNDHDNVYSPAMPYQQPRGQNPNYYHYQDNDAGYYYNYPPNNRGGRGYYPPKVEDDYDVSR